jgi:predicted metal-dependent enzyme (double-stranded beta helix superfamily)
LFEDQTVSIWHEKFLPEELIPPHDHQMPAFVGVYHGRECNRLYQHVGAKMLPAGDLILKAGEFHVFRPEEIHSVQALDGAPSLGLHVYLGPLSNCERSLFDWSTGAAVPMSEDAFNQMKRTV